MKFSLGRGICKYFGMKSQQEMMLHSMIALGSSAERCFTAFANLDRALERLIPPPFYKKIWKKLRKLYVLMRI